nr:hypothetical protein [Tanacetum cinerariifolium]
MIATGIPCLVTTSFRVPSARGSNFSVLTFSGSLEFSTNIHPTSSFLMFFDFLASVWAFKIFLGRSKPMVITKAQTLNGGSHSFLLKASAMTFAFPG